MALQTKTYSTGPNTRGYTLRLTLTEDSINVSGNYSSVSYTVELLSGSYNYGDYGTGYEVIINGVQVAYQDRSKGIKTSISKNSSLTLCSGSTTIVHNSDGSKTIGNSSSTKISAYLDIGGSPAPGEMTVTAESSGTAWTLTSIARKSTLSISNGTLGTSKSMTVTAANSNFSHTLTYSCGNVTNVSMGSSFTGGGTKSFTFPISLAAQNPTGTSVSVTVKLETFNGGTSLGSNSYSVTMIIPETADTKPTIGTITVSEPSGQTHISTFGTYIQSQSKINVSASPSPKANVGAAISSKTITIKSGSTVLYTSASNITNYSLVNTGTITITVSATDVRGFTNSASTTISVAAYTAPKITKINAIRATSSGAASQSGTYIKITFSATGTNISGNTMTYTAYYRVSGGSYSSASAGYSNNFNVSNGTVTIGGGNIATGSSYNVYIKAVDKFNTTNSITVTVSSQAAIFKVDAVNSAFSFGKVETKSNKLCVAWASEFDSSVSANSLSVVNGTTTNTLTVSTNATISNNATVSNNLTVNGTGSTVAAIKTGKERYYINSVYGIDMNNSDIINTNGIYFNDDANEPHSEGIHFYRGSNKWDTLYGTGGKLYWMANHNTTASGTAYQIPTLNDHKRYITQRVNGSNYFVNRWNDGLQEFWCTDRIEITSWGAFGSLYEGNTYRQFSYGSYPFKAYTYPMVLASASASFGLCGTELYVANSSRWQYSPRIYPLRPNTDYTGTVMVSLYAVGMWTPDGENLIPPIKDNTYAGVTTKLNELTGRTTISGTATATGGHGTLMSDSVSLSAGTYQVQVVTNGTNSCTDAWIRSSGTNHVQLAIGAGGTYTGSFTLSATTSVYASVRVTSGVAYNGNVMFTMYKTA